MNGLFEIVVRRLGLARNQMRRGSDTLEAVARCVLVTALLMMTVVAGLVGQHVRVTQQRLDEEQSHDRALVNAVVLRTEPASSGLPGVGSVPSAQALVRWRSDGATHPRGAHTATVSVSSHVHPGDHKRLWVDGRGRPATPPARPYAAVTVAVVAGIGVVAASVLTAVMLAAGLRWLLDRHRYAQWDREWSLIERHWSNRA